MKLCAARRNSFAREFLHEKRHHSMTNRVKAFKSVADAKLAGEWILAALFDDVKKQAKVARAGISITKAQGESVNTAGAFLAPDVLGDAILDVRDRYGVIRANAFMPPTGGMVTSWPRGLGTISATWVGEASTPADQTGTFDNINANAKKLMILVRGSAELGEDAPLAEWLASEIGRAFAQAEDQVGFVG